MFEHFTEHAQRVLDMEGLDDLKTEMDALDFGSLVHDVLHEMARIHERRGRTAERDEVHREILRRSPGDTVSQQALAPAAKPAA